MPSSEWEFLTPWCHALGPCLSVQQPVEFVLEGFVVQVDQFLGERRREYPFNGSHARLVFLREAIELLSLALQTSDAPARRDLLKRCQNERLLKQLDRLCADEWSPQFLLSLKGSRHGDSPFALQILEDLSTKAWRSELTGEYQAARAAILCRRGVDATAAFSDPIKLALVLQPPLKRVASYLTPYDVAPSRSDTINYYEGLFRVLKSLPQRERSTPIECLELDLTNLETPADVITRLGDILGLGIRIRRLAIQLGYSWDAFDQDKLVRVLNASTSTWIDHLVLCATTSDNLSAAFESFPCMLKVHHVELVDNVMYGSVAPAFVSAFRRVMMSFTQWTVKRLTLRGAHLEGMKLPPIGCDGAARGLKAIAIHLPGRDVEMLLRILPRFAADVTALEVRVTEEQTSTVSLQHIARACPSLRELQIHGTVIRDLGDLPESLRQLDRKWRSLVLQDVTIANPEDLKQFAQALASPISVLGRAMTRFELHQKTQLSQHEVISFEQTLSHNKRLEHLALAPVDASKQQILREFDHQRLTEHKYAFLSAVFSSARTSTALAEIDSWNLRHIMTLGGLDRVRRVRMS